MFTRLAIINSSVGFKDIAYALSNIGDKDLSRRFAEVLSEFTQCKYSYFTNYGISSFYIILESLKALSPDRKEVILPAYTAGNLIVAIKKAGLKPVLCDVSLDDFNADKRYLFKAATPLTLAVVCAHMFGIGLDYVRQLKEELPKGVFIIEDCAQAMGTIIRGKLAGGFGDAGFFSFNRGKNLSLYGGGCLFTNNGDLAKEINRVYGLRLADRQACLPAMRVLGENLVALLKVTAFSLAVNPSIFALTYRLSSLFKSNAAVDDFSVDRLSNFQAGLGLSIWNRKENFFRKRYKNGVFLIKALKGIEGIILPNIPESSQPAFNRLPVLFKDIKTMQVAKKRLWQKGIESSNMYVRPLHKMFNLGYRPQDFPNANYIAEHLLVLPAHPGVNGGNLLDMIKIIRESLK